MSRDLILKCLLAFLLGYLVYCIMRGNGLMVGGQNDETYKEERFNYCTKIGKDVSIYKINASDQYKDKINKEPDKCKRVCDQNKNCYGYVINDNECNILGTNVPTNDDEIPIMNNYDGIDYVGLEQSSFSDTNNNSVNCKQSKINSHTSSLNKLIAEDCIDMTSLESTNTDRIKFIRGTGALIRNGLPNIKNEEGAQIFIWDDSYILGNGSGNIGLNKYCVYKNINEMGDYGCYYNASDKELIKNDLKTTCININNAATRQVFFNLPGYYTNHELNSKGQKALDKAYLVNSRYCELVTNGVLENNGNYCIRSKCKATNNASDTGKDDSGGNYYCVNGSITGNMGNCQCICDNQNHGEHCDKDVCNLGQLAEGKHYCSPLPGECAVPWNNERQNHTHINVTEETCKGYCTKNNKCEAYSWDRDCPLGKECTQGSLTQKMINDGKPQKGTCIEYMEKPNKVKGSPYGAKCVVKQDKS
jgi:hypothetical protein